MARELGHLENAVYFDEEDANDQARLTNPQLTLKARRGVVILDEIQLRREPTMLFVDGVRGDHTLVVAGQFQTEPGDGLFALLLRRHFGFPIHTTEEQNFSGAAFAGCDETVTKGLRWVDNSPRRLG